MHRVAWILAAVAVVAVVAIGLSQASSGPKDRKLAPLSLAQARQQLKGSPAPLAALHAQGAQLLGGGITAMRARLKTLRGRPVIVNKWGSWCVPCRQEFPVLQRVAAKYGKRIAFVGVDVLDNPGDAASFLREFPVAYPSYRDPHGGLSQALGVSGGAPITLFLDARGRTAFIHQGQYKTQADLEADIKRYL